MYAYLYCQRYTFGEPFDRPHAEQHVEVFRIDVGVEAVGQDQSGAGGSGSALSGVRDTKRFGEDIYMEDQI